MLKVPCTKEDGLKINKKDKAVKNGLMEVSIKVNISEVRNMAKVYFSGLMVPNIVDNGKIIRCMAEASSNGLTVESMKVNMQQIKNMVKVFTRGQMVDFIKEDFIMESNTVKECIDKPVVRMSTEFG